MSSAHQNLSGVPLVTFAEAKHLRIAIVYARWNEQVTLAMSSAADEYLTACGLGQDQILHVPVPGTYELPAGAQACFETSSCDAVICIGCVIQGETRHFDFICQGVTNGIMEVMIKYAKPVAFGVLTTENLQQAMDRCGGKHGNKGTEAAYTVMDMLHTMHKLRRGELFKSK